MAVVQSEGVVVGADRPGSSWLAPPPLRGVELYAGTRQSYRTLYRDQPNVRLVVDFLARNIGSLPLKLFERVGETERRRLGPDDHEAAAVIHRPNPRTTRHGFVRRLVTDLGVFDEHFSLKLRNPETGRLSLFPLPPDRMVPVGDNAFFAERWKYLGATKELVFDAGDLVHLHGENPDDPRRGLSKLESLRRVLAEEAAAGEWRRQYWEGGARIAGVIERPAESGDWGETARDRFLEGWAAAYAGSGGATNRTPVLEDGMTYKPTTFSSHESEYLGARRLSREEVAAAYFIPPAFVGILENANFANMTEQHRSLYQDTLGPWLDFVTTELELQLLEAEYGTGRRLYLDFTLEEKLRGSFEEQMSALSTSTGAPFLTRNEARAVLNRPAIDGLDDPVVPLNVLVGGQASPRDSAPPKALEPGDQAHDHDHGTKALDELPRDLLGWRRAHEALLERYFERQLRSVLPRVGRSGDLETSFELDRWDRELERDLLGLSLELFEDVAGTTAKRFGGTVDPSIAHGYLRTSARVAAEKINRTTLGQVRDALSGAKARGRARPADEDLEDLDPDRPTDLVRDVFATAVAVRAPQAALSRVTGLGNFSRHEGARQSGVRWKVWVVNSAKSRHPGLNGERTPIGDVFSNGLRWPGDAGGDPSDTAGCLCSLDFEVGP